MNKAFDLEFHADCSNARVLYDLFQVLAKFGREVIDRVQVDQPNALGRAPRHQAQSLAVAAQPRQPHPGAGCQFDDLLAANAPLTTVHLLRAQLKEPRYAPDEQEAHRRWHEWQQLALQRGLKRVTAFAKRLGGYARALQRALLYRLNTSALEAISNRINGYRESSPGPRFR